jgi:hypothetical protein
MVLVVVLLLDIGLNSIIVLTPFVNNFTRTLVHRQYHFVIFYCSSNEDLPLVGRMLSLSVTL